MKSLKSAREELHGLVHERAAQAERGGDLAAW